MPKSTDVLKPQIFDLSFSDTEQLFREWKEPSYRVRQLWNGLYQQYWNSPEQFSNFPKYLRERLKKGYSFQILQPEISIDSRDGQTRKTVFYLENVGAIESVLMRYNKRNTLCISTQVGCAMGCVFCATGQMGFLKNLRRGQIVEQVLFYARQLSSSGEKVSNVVLMGMGEPFHNYDETINALETLSHPEGFNFSPRRFTISTVGLIPALRRFTKEGRRYNLAVSLHATNDNLRSALLPVNKKYPVHDLLAACQEYVIASKRRITFEWALIEGKNDSKEQAIELAEHLELFRISGSILCHVNIIPLNPISDYSGMAASNEKAKIFQKVLEEKNIPCTIRLRRGIDIQAGCGQLATQYKEKT